MKRLMLMGVAVVAMLLGCGVEARAQFDLGRLLGSLVQQPEEQTATPDAYQLLAEQAPARSELLGTWQYLAARVEHLGNNPLASAALSQSEALISAELKNRGIVEGCCSLTLRRNGVAVVGTLDHVFEGRYSYDGDTAQTTVSMCSGSTEYSVDGYVKFISGRLVVMIDIKDLLREVVKSDPSLATNETFIMLRSVLDSFGDTYLSVMFTR